MQNSQPKPVRIASVEWRDGQQSLLATRIRLEDMIPILPAMDSIGYDSMEMWGGATFDVALRFLNEDPWERIRQFKQHVTKTPLRMLLRGQNLVGYRQYADDVVAKFIETAAHCGIDIFLIFDGLNDVRNTEQCFNAVKKTGKRAEANIAYAKSPVHTVDYYLKVVEGYIELGAEAIHIEDMAGMLTPVEMSRIVSAVKARFDVPVHVQAHSIGGMADIAYWEAIRAGAEVIDCNVSALAGGPSHPATETFVVSLQETPYDTGINLEKVIEVNKYFLGLVEKYKEFKTEMIGVDASVQKHQIPGGMLSNLESQLKQMNSFDRIGEVMEEVYRVREDMGYPPLATPFAQIVAAQATTNVLVGSRYLMMSSEIKDYVKGLYGRVPGSISETLKEIVLAEDAEICTVRPGSLIEPEWEKGVEESRSFAKSDEDILSYILFPEQAKPFLENKNK